VRNNGVVLRFAHSDRSWLLRSTFGMNRASSSNAALGLHPDGFGNYDFSLSAPLEERVARLHADATIVDAIWWGPVTYRSFTADMESALKTSFERKHDVTDLMNAAQRMPGRLAVETGYSDYRANWDSSGVTAGHVEVQVGDPRLLLEGVSHVQYLVDHLPWLRKALVARDFRDAKREGGHALYLQCQPTPPISRDFGLVDLAYDAGLRVLQLSYNVQDAIATGCTDRSGGGVSRLGAKLIARLNALGIIVDTSHCNAQSVLDACHISDRPVIVSHTTSSALYPHDRGISDETAIAIAETDGVIGVVAVPFFLQAGAASIETMLDHIDHFVRTVGWQHVAIATDWPMAGPKWAVGEYETWMLANGFRQEHGFAMTQNLLGFDDYRDFPNITRGLVARGYSDQQVLAILGENFLRVFGAVCG
jgi:membrane dipeptidase